MDDLATTLHAIDRNEAPDLWAEIGRRVARAGSSAVPQALPEPHARGRGSRLVTIFVALAVGVAGSVFVVSAFHGTGRSVHPSGLGSPSLSITRDGCDNAVGGNLPPRWKSMSIIRGPIAFLWLPGAQLFPSGPGTVRHARGSKVLVLVKDAATVTVSISPEEQHTASLNYPPVYPVNKDGSYHLDQGQEVVTFEACTGSTQSWGMATQFNGGVLATGPMCLHLDVTTTGAVPSTATVAAPIGEGATCPRPAG